MRAIFGVVTSIVVLFAAMPAAGDRLVNCRQRLVGELRGGGRVMPVELNLHLVSYAGLNVSGRMRCTKNENREEHCFLPRVVVRGVFDFDATGANSLGREGRLTLTGKDGTRCTLEATTPYVRKLCLGSVGGRFECTNSPQGSVSGAFGFSVDRCGPCLVGY